MVWAMLPISVLVKGKKPQGFTIPIPTDNGSIPMKEFIELLRIFEPIERAARKSLKEKTTVEVFIGEMYHQEMEEEA